MSTSKCQAVLTSFMIVITFVLCVVAEQQSPPSAILQPPPAPQNPQDSNEKVLKIEKRSWNNLQSSWGKRRVLDDAIATRLLNLNSGGNRDTLNDLFERNNDGHDFLIDDILDTNRYDSGPIEGTFGDDDDYYRQIGEKRAWKNMNGAWGKRVEKDWNKFRGSWGKREPGWNNLKGLWGKRNNWNKLQSAWGKREASTDSVDTY